ncbi:MAG TPA: MarR family transcriptional regulator [Oligoflexia bacterium]|nr:MarR family transcriptional regulator [Oligoflexia bacterium]HMR24645.1 MarR family transcriptional regulator [Oligoflexia bacterium]
MQMNHDISDLDIEIIAQLRKLIRAEALFSQEIKNKSGLNASQLACLTELADRGELSFRELSRLIHVSPSSVTKIIDVLEHKFFVQRKREGKDRRVIKAVITAKGNQIVAASPKSMQKKMLEGLAMLSYKNKQQIKADLEQLALLIGAQDLPTGVVLDAVENLNEEPSLTEEKVVSNKSY